MRIMRSGERLTQQQRTKDEEERWLNLPQFIHIAQVYGAVDDGDRRAIEELFLLAINIAQLFRFFGLIRRTEKLTVSLWRRAPSATFAPRDLQTTDVAGLRPKAVHWPLHSIRIPLNPG
jgi:hypothetical protein